MTSMPLEMPNHALPPATKIETMSMMTVMMPLVVKPRCMVARMERLSACMAARSASSKSSRSKSSRPQVLTARMLVTASESTPERRFCALAVAAESGRMRWYIRVATITYTTSMTASAAA